MIRLPVPPAKQTVAPADSRTKTICARWLDYVIRKDPKLDADVETLIADFADRQGFSVLELNTQFREEEERLRPATEEKRKKTLALIAEREARERAKNEKKKTAESRRRPRTPTLFS